MDVTIFKRYPHLAAIGISYLVVSALFLIIGSDTIHDLVKPLGIGGIFLAGMMYAYSLTAGVATIIIPSFSVDYSIEVIAVIGAAGNLFTDIVLYQFIKEDLKEELKHLRRLPTMKIIFKEFAILKKKWFRTALGFLVIASPLPDEIGIAFLASIKISDSTFRVLVFLANLIGIYALVNVVGGLY